MTYSPLDIISLLFFQFFALTFFLIMIQLGVNVDHIATLRQARGTQYPDPVYAALLAEQAGADAITVHLREDRRHIQDDDLERLRPQLKTRMNLESAITEEMIEIACRVLPQDACLVPERRQELTTEGGLNVIQHFELIKQAIQRLHQHAIQVSLFIDPDLEQIKAAQQAGAKVIELHTGAYADRYSEALNTITSDNTVRDQALSPLNTPVVSYELKRIEQAVHQGLRLGLKVNAGHGLNLDNVSAITAIPGIAELNIGHALVARAVFIGWQAAIREMKQKIISGSSHAR